MKNKKLILVASVLLIAGVLFVFLGAHDSHAIEYTSMIASTDFDVAKADVQTTASGVLGIVFTLMVIGLIIAVVTR